MFLVMARKLMKECWFEKGYLHMGMVYRNYGYGHRIAPRCRPQNAQPMLDNYALAYLFIAR